MKSRAMNLLKRYRHWLHTQWPAGHVEPLPDVDEKGQTHLPGVYVVGDLRGIPLLKFSVDSGTKAVRLITESLQSLPPRSPARPATEGGGEGTDSSRGPSPSRGEGVVYDLLIIGAGVSGMAAALEAKKQNLSFKILEASEPFSTILNFPKAKPIFTYPKEMTPAGELKVSADIKEALVEELRAQTTDIHVTQGFVEKIQRKEELLEVIIKSPSPPAPLHILRHYDPADAPTPQWREGRGAGGEGVLARRVIIAIGRSGNFRKLNVPGENLDKVYNRLHDPKDFSGKKALVVGGGDSALETAIALTFAGAEVTLSYRQKEFSRAKPENIEMVQELAKDPMAPAKVENPTSERITTAVNDFMERRNGSLRLLMGSAVQEIRSDSVVIKTGDGPTDERANDVVFTMIGRDAPLDFFRRSGIRITGEWTPGRTLACAAFVLFCFFLYNWKSAGFLSDLFYRQKWFPTNLVQLSSSPAAVSGGSMDSPLTAGGNDILSVLLISASSPSFWYTLAYSLIVVIFGIKRIRRRKTPYVKWQTLTLMTIQVFPLFLLPEIILPWLGHNDLLPHALADALFPAVSYGHGREYWRAYGFILAWPLMVYNVFTHQPLGWWLLISFVQTFVIIPTIIYRWGKGAYCGWICSCGALAETLGDTHRQKMPHGPLWNRLNMIGQGILALCFLMLFLRVLGWVLPGGNRLSTFFSNVLLQNYKWIVDVGLAGILGYGLYFWFSGRVWCRFACPLAALMHIYARFSRFRILADKKKCISCNVCTSVCHQGIDVMNFANKGLPMNDPQCVRCSACVQMCPTEVLSFGQIKGRHSPPSRLATRFHWKRGATRQAPSE